MSNNSRQEYDNIMKQLYNKTGITKQNIKTIDANKQLIHLETTAGIRLNFIINTNNQLINVSYLLKQLLNSNKIDINKRIARWVRTKQGVWFIDNLMKNTSPRNENLAYSFNNQTLWYYKLSKTDNSYIYEPIFKKSLLKSAFIYSSYTDYFDFKQITVNPELYNKFNIIKNTNDPEHYDCYCCYEAVIEILKLFNVNLDRPLNLVLIYLFNLIKTDEILDVIKSHSLGLFKVEFNIDKLGFINYKVIRDPNIWLLPEERGFEPVYYRDDDIWSPIIGYRIRNHPEIPLSASNMEKVRTDTKYTADLVIKQYKSKQSNQ